MADFGNHTLLAPRVLGVLSGIQAGVIGGVAMLALMAVVSIAGRDPWWAYPNLLATAFYGGRALHMGLGWPTLAGIAFQILMAGVAGSIFGASFASVASVPRLMLLGVIWGLAWFYITESSYRLIARLVLVYVPGSALLGAHTVFGLILGRFSRTHTSQVISDGGDES